MPYQDVFPKFGELDLVLPPGFSDVSHSTHAMPTFNMVLPNGNVLRLQIDFEDKALSKFPNQPRFCLSVFSAGGIRMHDDIQNNSWIETTIIVRGLQEFHTVHGSNREP